MPLIPNQYHPQLHMYHHPGKLSNPDYICTYSWYIRSKPRPPSSIAYGPPPPRSHMPPQVHMYPPLVHMHYPPLNRY